MRRGDIVFMIFRGQGPRPGLQVTSEFLCRACGDAHLAELRRQAVGG
jgi:hypothetical protein